jgi:hypothetical protein
MPKEIISDDRARQGPPGRPVLRVLVGALFLCVVAISGYLVWVGTSSPDDPRQDASRDATTGSSSGSSNANPTDRTSPANPAYPAPAAPSATGTTNR